MSVLIAFVIACRNQVTAGAFEDTGNWLPGLEDTVIAVSSKLFQQRSTVQSFYMDQLLAELEELSLHLTLCGGRVERGWAVRLLRRLDSQSYFAIVDMYARLLESWGGASVDKCVHAISSLTYALSAWIKLVEE